MNANETEKTASRKIFEAGDSFAECCRCETAASENREGTREEASEEGTRRADAQALAAEETAGKDSTSGVTRGEAKRQETFAEVSARIIKEFCDRLGIPREIPSGETRYFGTSRGTWPSAVRRRLRGSQGPCEQSSASAERRQTRDWADSCPVESATPGEV